MIEELFRETISEYKLIKKKDKIIIGVSGGGDSVCLFHLLCNIQKEFNLSLICAHFNHSLRNDADSDEQFVKSLCKSRGIKFTSAKKDVKKFFHGDSLEQTARQLRFDFFFSCARQYKIKKIALAHNRDDVVETTLMRIIRGTALCGLRGILPCSRFQSLSLIRPLLRIKKTDILGWLNKNEFSYKNDSTNFQDLFFRNKVRLKLLPALCKFNPNISEAIYNMATTSARDYEFIHAVSKDALFSARKQRGKSYIKLRIEDLKKMPKAIIFNVLRLAVEEVKGNTRKLEARHYNNIVSMINKNIPAAVIDMPDTRAIVEDGWLTIKSLLF
ncbi:MAG: tRNA lysidine(34) synthetase TilS [Candidatus Omnitrophota bacterium]